MIASMEEIFVVLKRMQQENQSFCESITHLLSIQASTSLGCVPTTPLPAKEPQIYLPKNFDKRCSKFQSFKVFSPSAFSH